MRRRCPNPVDKRGSNERLELEEMISSPESDIHTLHGWMLDYKES